MTIWFVSRHAGAIAWAKNQNFAIDIWAEHLDPSSVQCGDIVIGTLPMPVAAEVCRRGARFFSIELHLARSERGRELSLQDMENLECTLREFMVSTTHETLPEFALKK